MTLICTPIMVQDEASALRDAGRARNSGADLVEYRLDEFFSGSGGEAEISRVVRLVSESPLPCIATCRPAWEGGHYDGDEDARVSLFERLGTAFGEREKPPRYIDIELSTLARSANIRQKVRLAVEHPEQLRDLSTSLILSLHDFQGRPADLSRRLLAMRAEAAAKVLKIAYRARSLRDNVELFELLAHQDRPTIALGMGEFGVLSRVLAPKFGGFLTYASLRPETVTAPGQPTVRELISLYRFRQISKATAVYGVVGFPVSQSLSPLVHNAGFEAVGHDGVYLPLPIAEGYESLKATVLELLHYTALGLRGLSITHPHKEHILRLARESGWEVDPVAEALGAANTLAVEGDVVRIFNTDVLAVREAMGPALGGIVGKRVSIVGAGGAARAAAFALAEAGGRVSVFARAKERAERLVGEFGARLNIPVEHGDLKDAADAACDALINCTPVGMRDAPGAEETPVDVGRLAKKSPGTLVMDTVYNPVETPLLREARSAGLRTLDGVSMFVHQAAAQFAAWTGHPAPLALFERIVREVAGSESGHRA
jgi:3-dehydroquinate dehydratase / shikimate dehydrogenase